MEGRSLSDERASFGRSPLGDAVRAAASAFGIAPEEVQELPGVAGQTWSAGGCVIRLRPAEAVEREIAGCTAAGGVVPVPRVIDVVDLEAVSAILLERLPGRPVGAVARLSPARARRRGLACEEAQVALTPVLAPAAVPRVPAQPGVGQLLEGDRLLHLDLHTFNILVGEDDQVTGVVDWANAAAGSPDLDRARTATIFRWDPVAVARRADPAWSALTVGWEEAAALDALGRAPLVWALHFLAEDVAGRYREEELSGLHRELRALSSNWAWTAGASR